MHQTIDQNIIKMNKFNIFELRIQVYYMISKEIYEAVSLIFVISDWF